MDKEYLNILFFGHKTSKTRHLRISKSASKILLYLLAFSLLSIIFFLCDYIQVKKKAYHVNRIRQEMKAQHSQIHSFLAKIDELEGSFSKLKDFESKIRIIANLEKRGQETTSLIGVGGPSPSDIRGILKEGKDEKELIQQMRYDIERLQSEATSREESLLELEKLLLAKKVRLAHTPSVWPVEGWLTSGFGIRTNPFTGSPQMHEGLDIANRVGTAIFAPGNGIISDIGKDLLLGRVLVISHGFGINTRYGHLHKILVKIGQKVKRGDKIAELGSSGRTTGPHLHYEVRIDGVPVNPRKYILN